MHRAPKSRIVGQLVDPRDGQNDTYGGSRDTDVSDWQVNPTGRPASEPVITAIPVQKWPSTHRIAGDSGANSATASVLSSRMDTLDVLRDRCVHCAVTPRAAAIWRPGQR